MARFLQNRKVQEWQQRLVRFDNSRRSVHAFCQQEGVSPQSFYLWRSRLAQSAAAAPAAGPAADAFLPVRVLAAGNMQVRLPGGTRFVVPVDAGSLQMLVETLARLDANRLGGASPC